MRASCFHTISRFSNSTLVDITVYQHGTCFMFLNYNSTITTDQLDVKQKKLVDGCGKQLQYTILI